MKKSNDLKLEVANFGYNISSKIGLEDPYIKFASRFEPENHPLEGTAVSEDIRSYDLENENTKGYVLIPTVQPSLTRCIFAHAFRSRGYIPIVLSCSSCLSHCFRKRVKEKYNSLICSSCINRQNETLAAFNLDYYTISNFTESDPIPINQTNLRSFEYKEIDVSRYSLSSTRKYLKKYRIDLDDEHEREVYLKFMRSAIELIDAFENIMDEFDLQAVVGSDPMYVYDGVFFAAADKYGIPAADPSRGWQKGKRIFGFQNNRQPLANYSDEDSLDRHLNKELSKGDRKRLDNVMKKRMDLEKSDNPHLKYSKDCKRDWIESSTDDLFVLFTNLLWDASLADGDTAFTDPFEWLKYTLREFEQMNEKKIIIKTHPAEALRGTDESVYRWICDTFTDLPDNLEILAPRTDISPYELMKEADTGIVWNSTAGLEMAYLNKPVIVVGDTHYRGKGFTYDMNEPSEYTRCLSSNKTLSMTETMKERAERYAHYLFIKKHIDYPFDKRLHENTMIISHEDIRPGNEKFDLMIDGILSGGPILD